MARSMTPEELVRALNEGCFKPAIIREGLVKVIPEDPQALLFSEGRGCHNWTRIPLDIIDSVEYESLVGCGDHEHPFVRLFLKTPTDNPAAAVFAELLLQSGAAMRTESTHHGGARGPVTDVVEHADEGEDSMALQTMAATQRIDIQFQRNGDGTLTCGAGSFPCLGRPGIPYPRDITITTADKHGTHYSSEFHVWMNYSILIWGQRGIYIHEWGFCNASGGQSAGCIHLCPGAAATVYNWIVRRTRITINYPW